MTPKRFEGDRQEDENTEDAPRDAGNPNPPEEEGDAGPKTRPHRPKHRKPRSRRAMPGLAVRVKGYSATDRGNSYFLWKHGSRHNRIDGWRRNGEEPQPYCLASLRCR